MQLKSNSHLTIKNQSEPNKNLKAADTHQLTFSAITENALAFMEANVVSVIDGT